MEKDEVLKSYEKGDFLDCEGQNRIFNALSTAREL
jgi:hypothetical protein